MYESDAEIATIDDIHTACVNVYFVSEGQITQASTLYVGQDVTENK